MTSAGNHRRDGQTRLRECGPGDSISPSMGLGEMGELPATKSSGIIRVTVGSRIAPAG